MYTKDKTQWQYILKSNEAQQIQCELYCKWSLHFLPDVNIINHELFKRPIYKCCRVEQRLRILTTYSYKQSYFTTTSLI
jgi:hypothetical protein